MSIKCTRCDGTGFLNTHQLPNAINAGDQESVLHWLESTLLPTDVRVCDCCGDGDGEWYGTPGEHYNDEDQQGPQGPYSYNGGLCECH